MGPGMRRVDEDDVVSWARHIATSARIVSVNFMVVEVDEFFRRCGGRRHV